MPVNKNQRVTLAEQELSVKEIAQKVNRHAGYVSQIFSGHYGAPKLRQEIAEILGKPVDFLWPEDEK